MGFNSGFKGLIVPVLALAHVYFHVWSHTLWTPSNISLVISHLNAELNPICHLPALLGAHHILHVSRIRVRKKFEGNKRSLKVLGRNTNKMQLCNRIYHSKVYWRLNMLRAAHRSSSGALNCICSLWYMCPFGDRPLPRLSEKWI